MYSNAGLLRFRQENHLYFASSTVRSKIAVRYDTQGYLFSGDLVSFSKIPQPINQRKGTK